MIGRKKKELTKDDLTRVIRNLEKVKMRIEARRSMLESQIKMYLRKGKTPPAGLLVSWRLANRLGENLDSVISSLYGTLMLQEIKEGFEQALGESGKVAGLIEALQNFMDTFKESSVTLYQITRMGQRLLESAQTVSQSVESVMAELSSTSEEIMPDVEDTLREFIETQKKVDPEFVNSLPEDLKKIAEGG